MHLMKSCSTQFETFYVLTMMCIKYVCLFHSRVVLDRIHLADDSELDQQDETAGPRLQDTIPVSSLEPQASVELVSQARPHQDSDKKPPGTKKEEVSDTLHRYGYIQCTCTCTCRYSTYDGY